MQVAAQVIGNDTAITIGGMQGNLELNVRVPLIARNLLDSIRLLAPPRPPSTRSASSESRRTSRDASAVAESTLAAATALNPHIGYDAAAEIVKEATKSGRPLREVAREKGVSEATSTRHSICERWRSGPSSPSGWTTMPGVGGSPLEQFLAALDELDVDSALGLMSPDCELLTVDGRRSEGVGAAGEMLREFMATLRSTEHRITSQWQQDGVWFAEVEADYELQDWLELKALPRAFVVRTDADKIVSVHVYGAHERAMGDPPGHEPKGLRVGGRWIPPM